MGYDIYIYCVTPVENGQYMKVEGAPRVGTRARNIHTVFRFLDAPHLKPAKLFLDWLDYNEGPETFDDWPPHPFDPEGAVFDPTELLEVTEEVYGIFIKHDDELPGWYSFVVNFNESGETQISHDFWAFFEGRCHHFWSDWDACWAQPQTLSHNPEKRRFYHQNDGEKMDLRQMTSVEAHVITTRPPGENFESLRKGTLTYHRGGLPADHIQIKKSSYLDFYGGHLKQMMDLCTFCIENGHQVVVLHSS